jgi:hypothetical protein
VTAVTDAKTRQVAFCITAIIQKSHAHETTFLVTFKGQGLPHSDFDIISGLLIYSLILLESVNKSVNK